jgi:hypothetical protein
VDRHESGCLKPSLGAGHLRSWKLAGSRGRHLWNEEACHLTSLLPCRLQQMGGLWTGIRPVHIIATSKMVSDYSGMIVQPHKVQPTP